MSGSVALEKYEQALMGLKSLIAQQKSAEKASEARFNLPHGTSRARVTTANARWMATCEHRDRLIAALRETLREAGI